jgi:hypothetical protein
VGMGSDHDLGLVQLGDIPLVDSLIGQSAVFVIHVLSGDVDGQDIVVLAEVGDDGGIDRLLLASAPDRSSEVDFHTCPCGFPFPTGGERYLG